MSNKGLWVALIAISLAGLASNAVSEPIFLRCDLERGSYWDMKIDLEEDMLFVGPKYSAPIVEASDGWIIASSTAINLLSEYGPPLESPFVENWAFDRSTGQFWHSTFSFECDAADIPCSDGGFHFFDTYTGWCASRF